MNPRMSLMVLFAAASVAVHAANHEVTAFAGHQSAATALRVRPGDTITLPALAEGVYAAGNSRLASVSGNIVTVLEPGVLAVFQLAADETTVSATLPVFVLPEPTGTGRVFICDDNHWAFDQRGWCTTEGLWINAADNARTDYPRLPDDIAMIGRWGNGYGRDLVVSSDVTVGAVYYGNFVDFGHFGDGNQVFKVKSGGDAGVVFNFARSGKGNALLRYCPNMRDEGHKCMFGFASGITVTSACNVDIDFGWDESANHLNLGYFKLFSDATLNIPEGKTFKFINSSPHQGNAMHADIELLGIISGAGTLQNSSRENMLCDFSNATAFTGTIHESGYRHASFDRDATTWFLNCTTLQNAALEVSGYVVRTDYKTFPLDQSAGYARIGQSHTWPGQDEVSNRLPGRALVLNGGNVALLDEQKTWSDGAVNTYSTAHMAVSNGYTRLEVKGNNDKSFPKTLFEAAAVSHANKATLAIRCNGLWTQNGEHSERVDVDFPWFPAYAAATGGIVPWIVAWQDQADYGNAGGWESLRFASADENGKLVPTADGEYAEGKNAVISGTDLKISADMAVNSLFVHNEYNGGKRIGEGRTLTITSGGLILGNKTRIGENNGNASDIAGDCGALAFGATAYVFANCPNESQPAWIAVPMTAPQGFVSGFPGYLEIAGDQTGIDDEIAVMAGRLTLGIARNNNGADLVIPCQIDVSVRIVGGGATLKLAANSHLASDQNVYFNDVGGYAGKLDIPAGATETCMKCYVDSRTIARGTWGATGSGADNIDDEHFSGLGVLVVRKDSLNHPMVIVVR